MMTYRNIETGVLYRQLAIALDITSTRKENLIVVYCQEATHEYAIYARDQAEFNQKFEMVESPP